MVRWKDNGQKQPWFYHWLVYYNITKHFPLFWSSDKPKHLKSKVHEDVFLA